MYINTDGVDLYYEEIGEGTPLLCLHAYPADGRMWAEQHALATDARLIIPDLRGQGRSSVPVDSPYYMEMLAQDMFHLLDALQIERTVVIGLSLGGYVAMAMCKQAPDRIRGLILVDTRAEADTPEAKERRLAVAGQLRQQGPSYMVGGIANLFSDRTKRERPELIAQMQNQVLEANAEGLALMQLGMAERPDSVGFLSRFLAPTLVLCGEEDALTSCELMSTLATTIPHARYTTIPNAGHLSALENPLVFNKEVAAFLHQLIL